MGDAANLQKNRAHRINLGSPSAWLYGRPGHWLLIDAGTKAAAPVLFKRLEELKCAPNDIKLLVITHAHFDHTGAAAELQRAGVPIAIHALDAEVLKNGIFRISNGLNPVSKASAWFLRNFVSKKLFAFDPATADILIDSPTRLDKFGFGASIISSPGHSPASISVLGDDGYLFPGDLVVNRPYPGIWKHMSVFGTSREEILRSWKMMIEKGARTICPGHGAAFPVSEISKYCGL